MSENIPAGNEKDPGIPTEVAREIMVDERVDEIYSMVLRLSAIMQQMNDRVMTLERSVNTFVGKSIENDRPESKPARDFSHLIFDRVSKKFTGDGFVIYRFVNSSNGETYRVVWSQVDGEIVYRRCVAQNYQTGDERPLDGEEANYLMSTQHIFVRDAPIGEDNDPSILEKSMNEDVL